MLTPEEIAARRFLVALRGYERDEVEAFLREVAGEVGQVHDRIAELEREVGELRKAEGGPAGAAGDAERALGEQTARILAAAREAAEEIHERAEQQAHEELEGARQRARQDLEEARRRARRVVADAVQRRDDIAAEIESMAATRDRLASELRSAMATVGAAITKVLPADEDEEPPPVMPAEGVDARELRVQSLAGIRPGMLRRLRRGLQELQRATAEAAGAGDGAAAGDGAGDEAGSGEAVGSGAEALEALGWTGDLFLSAAYQAGRSDGAALLGRHVDVASGDPSRPAAVAARFRETVTRAVEEALATARRRGGGRPGEPNAAERAGDAFHALQGAQIEALADEHLDDAYADGFEDAWRSLGVTRIVWQLGEEPDCPGERCRANADAGAVALGEAFPSGDRIPPAHEGCTCVVVPEPQGPLP